MSKLKSRVHEKPKIMTALLIAIAMSLSGWGINTAGLSEAQLKEKYEMKLKQDDPLQKAEEGNGNDESGAGRANP